MPRQCPVPLCRNVRGSAKFKDVTFHKFPKDPLRRHEWLIKCQILDLSNPDSYTVCSDHFVKSDYIPNVQSSAKKLKPSAVPSRRLPPDWVYMKKQDSEPIVIDADPMPLLENPEDSVSPLDNPREFQNLILKDAVVNSPLDIPQEYQLMMLKDDVTNSSLDTLKVYQHMMLKDEVVSSPLDNPRVNQPMLSKNEAVCSPLNKPRADQHVMLKDEMVSSPLDDPRVYQHMMLKDKVVSSLLDNPRVYQRVVLKDEVISSPLDNPRVYQPMLSKNEAVCSPLDNPRVDQLLMLKDEVVSSPLDDPRVYQQMMLKDEVVCSPLDNPRVCQRLVLKDEVVSSPLDNPRAYQPMMLKEEVVSSPVDNSRLYQHVVLKDEVVSSHRPVLSPLKPFMESVKTHQNLVIKICKFVKPLHVAKKLSDEDIPLSDLKAELSKPPIRPPLAVMNDVVSAIHYDHSYARPFSDNLVHKISAGSNYPLNENGQIDQSFYSNEVGTMTELLGEECDRIYEFEREIRWLWQRNQKMHGGLSLLMARNRELVSKNLRTRKELLQKTEKLNKFKKQVAELKQKHPELKIEID